MYHVTKGKHDQKKSKVTPNHSVHLLLLGYTNMVFNQSLNS